MERLFGGVYAAATLGQFLREFTHGHTLQLGLGAARASGQPGRHAPVCCPASSSGRWSTSTRCCARSTGTASRAPASATPRSPASRSCAAACHRWSPRSAPTTGAPVIAGIRLRAGKAGSGQGRRVDDHRSDPAPPRPPAPPGEILVRGDSAYGNSAVVSRLPQGRGPVLGRADQEPAPWPPRSPRFPRTRGRRCTTPAPSLDPDTGAVDLATPRSPKSTFTAFASTKTPVTARLIVRRVRDRAQARRTVPGLAAPPVPHQQHRTDRAGRHHPPPARHHRNRPLRPHRRTPWRTCPPASSPPTPPGRSAPRITHNLLRAAGTLAGDRHAVARGATLRRHLIAVPARLARPQRRPVLHLPAHWPWAEPWQRLWTAASDPPAAA